jgi:hypothetical protein
MISGVAFSQTLFWSEPAENPAPVLANPHSTSVMKKSDAVAESPMANLLADESASASSEHKSAQYLSFKGLVQLYQPVNNPPVNTLSATPSAPHVIVYGSSPSQDSLWAIDTSASWTIVQRLSPSLPGFTITGMTGMAFDPCGGQVYIIMKISSVSGRVLGTIDLNTGVCTQIGNLGNNFSSLTFGPDGQLYGATGDGATVPEALYKIDKTNGTKTLMYLMGNGADGEIISYNYWDNFIYHWSGNGTVVYEKMAASNTTYTPTNIPIIGTTNGETFGAICIGPTTFLTSNISNSFNHFYSTGNVNGPFGSNPDDLRGLVILPRFATSATSICLGDSFQVANSGVDPTNSNLVFDWGDSQNSTIAPNALASHAYAAAGTYTVTISLNNGVCSSNATVATYTVTVNPTPVVSLGTSSGFNAICAASSLDLVGNVPAGTYQWYMDGSPVASATSSTLTVTSGGNYNLYVVDANGCADSAATGLSIFNAPNLTVNLGNDTTVCGGITLDAGNAGASYVWQDNSSNQTFAANSTATYNVTVTDANGCSSGDTINVTVNANPVVSLGNDTTVCGSLTLDAGNPGATYLWCNASTAQTVVMNASGTCEVVVTDANGCQGTDTISFTVNPNPVVNLGPDGSSCGAVVLDAGSGFTSYLWCDNSTGQTHLVTSSGTCDVTVTDANGCSGSDTITLTINSSPTVSVSASSSSPCLDDANVTLTGTPAGGTFSGPGVTGNSFDPSIGVGAQTVSYSFTDSNGCIGTNSTVINVNACVGIAENSNAEAISVYPNPGSGLFNVTLNNGPAAVNVFDASGKLIGSYQYESGILQIDGSNWAAGIYTMQAVSKTAVAQVRLVITK